MSDAELLKKLEEYKALAKENKNIDVGTLMLSAMEQQQRNLLSVRLKRWAYLISLAFPPFGLFFAIYFYNSGKEDAKHAALVCVILTVFVVVLLVILFKVFLSTAGVDVNQLQQAPTQLRQLLQ